MKRLAALIFIAIFVLGALASCADDVTTSPETTAETTAKPEPVPTPKTVKLRIGSYNIANGKKVNHDLSVIAQDIIDNKLDIVGLQEVDRFASRSKFIDTAKDLAELTGLEYYYYTKAINIDGNEAKYGTKGEYGTCIISRYPITSSESVHLFSGGKEQRMLSCVEIDVDGTTINFLNTHLSYELAAIRQRQFEALAERVSGKEYCIVTGDFNISSFDDFAPVDFLTKACTEQGKPITFPSSKTTIDNILFSEEFTLVKRDSVANDHSDHYMLWAELEFTVMVIE